MLPLLLCLRLPLSCQTSFFVPLLLLRVTAVARLLQNLWSKSLPDYYAEASFGAMAMPPEYNVIVPSRVQLGCGGRLGSREGREFQKHQPQPASYSNLFVRLGMGVMLLSLPVYFKLGISQ